MTKGKKIGLAIVAFATISMMIHITTKHANRTIEQTYSTPTNGLESVASGSKYLFDVEMSDDGHTTSKGLYTGLQRGSFWTITFRGDVKNDYIDNMVSWDTATGSGKWKSEQHVSGKLGQRVSGSCKVTANPDGTLALVLLDKSGNRYSEGEIRPQF